jgi:hypothetical protein
LLIIVAFVEKTKLSAMSKFLTIPLTVIIALAIIISNLTAYVGRGDLMVSGAGRFRAWSDLSLLKPWQIILGSGLGAGTNSARSLGIATVAMDSSFTIFIVQYGIWGFALVIIQMIKVFVSIYKKLNYKWYALTLIAITFLILFSGSLLEQYTLVVPIIMVFCEIYKQGKIEIPNGG